MSLAEAKRGLVSSPWKLDAWNGRLVGGRVGVGLAPNFPCWVPHKGNTHMAQTGKHAWKILLTSMSYVQTIVESAIKCSRVTALALFMCNPTVGGTQKLSAKNYLF